MDIENSISDDPKEFKCEVVLSRNGTTLGLGWEGIPTNLIINSFVFIFMTLLFFCLRRKAWNRKALQLSRTRKGWLYFIYGNRENRKKVESVPSTTDHHVHENQMHSRILLPPTATIPINQGWEENIVTIEMPSEVDIENGTPSTLQTRKKITTNHNGESSAEENGEDASLDKRRVRTTFNRSMSSTEFGYWLFDILCIREKDILNKKGSDAVQYLLFQRYLIYYLILLTCICMIVVLPVNLMGTTEPETKPFGRTTISNTLSNPNLLWCHVIISVILLAFGFFLMCHFSKTIKEDEAHEVKRTLCIRRIPKSKRNKEKLYEHFQKMFPDIVIEGIQFVYNTKRLKAIYTEYNSVVNAKYYCHEYLNEFHDRCEVYPYFLGHCGSTMICCNCYKVDGITYYESRELELERDVEKEFRDCISDPSGSVFITLKTEKMAQKVYSTLRQNQEKSCGIFPCNCCFRLGTWLRKLIGVQDEDEFETYRWLVSYASYPDDINWDDIAVDYKLIWMRRIVIHLFLFVIFFFLSTPSIVISILDVLQIESTLRIGLEYMFFRHSQFATEYLSPLLMVIASIILPSFVILASQYLPYKTLSDLNHSIMWKVFLFLIMMVIILPSLGLSSAQALLSSITNTSNQKFKWECLFPVDNGAFFVNYVLQSTLLSNAMELLRFPELFLYFFYYTFYAKTPAEYDKARQQVIFDFQFGIRYPRFLLIFCMVVTYSLSCPLIAPCGLLYMVIKHIVDRYNIYYVYTPSKINGRIHSTAITFFHIGILMMVFQIFTFAFLKNSQSDQSKILMIVVIIASLVFSGHCFYHCFWNINHLTYSATLRRVSKRTQTKEFCACTYLPSVLFDLNLNGIVPPESLTQKTYGSVTPSPSTVPIRSSDSNQKLNITTLTA